MHNSEKIIIIPIFLVMLISIIISVISPQYNYSIISIQSQALSHQIEYAKITHQPLTYKNTSAYVKRVIDGDTIELQNGKRVRLICIDTPEKGEEGYNEAADYLKSPILNKRVKLQRDVSDKDHYGRLLRYVYVKKTFVNKEMVQKGYAKPYPYKKDITLCQHIEQAM